MTDHSSFSESRIPGVDDAESLAAWDGRDPLKVVLPLALAAAWAYADRTTFDRVMKRRGLHGGPSTLLAVDNDAMFVCAKTFIQPVGKGAVVAFRGTPPTNVVNWLADATLKKAAFHAKGTGAPRGWVHGGFYRNTRAIWPDVVETLHRMDPEWIYFTGHSFGGALALLASALLSDYAVEKPQDLGRLWSRVRGIVTFGQPMVGDETFAATYKGTVEPKLVRFVYEHDIVPHLPPKTSGWTPVHFGAEYRAPEGKTWNPGHLWSRGVIGAIGASVVGVASWMQDQVGLAPRLALPYSWGDHAPNNYVRASLPHGAESGSEFD